MSYILEALRRADAQRSREQATASGQLLSNLDDPLQNASRRRRMPPGLVLSAVGLATAAALAWLVWGSGASLSTPSTPAATVASVATGALPNATASPPATSSAMPMPGTAEGTAATAAAAPAAAATAPARAPNPPPPSPAQAVGALVTPADQIRPAAPPLAPPPVMADLPKVPGVNALPPIGSSRVGPASPVPTATTPPRPAGAAGNVGAPPPAAVPVASPAPVPTPTPTPTPTPNSNPPAAGSQPSSGAGLVTGWPADAPKLALSGGVYSVNAAQRMVIVNGQVVREGAEAAPGVTVEQIRPQSAVLVRNGQRYLLPF